MAREIRYAARRLVQSPAFTIASILTLALGIGANTAIFAVVERVLLNPLPYPDSDRLVDLDHGATTSSGRSVPSGIQMSAGLYYHYMDRARTLESVALYRTGEQTLTDRGEPERIRVARVTPSLAAAMQVPPIAGRWFAADEGAPAPIITPVPQPVSQTAVLSYRIWMRRYGGDRSLVARTVSLDGVPTEVVGIMPPQFAFPDAQIDIWIPEPIRRQTVWDSFMHSAVARLRPGVSAADARQELSGLIADLPNVYPNDPTVRGFLHNLGLRSAAQTLKDSIVGRVANALWIVLASVGVMLIVACANVANLFLVRSESRQRDVAVRRALGASRGDIARYVLAESMWLGAAGATVGFLIAFAGVRLLVRFGPDTLPRLGEVRLDWIAAVFNVAVAAMAAVAFGTIPLLRHSPLVQMLHQGGRTIASRGGHLVRHTLMGAQVALALVLLVASGLLVRSFQAMRNLDPAFDASSALTFRIGLPAATYPRQPGITDAHRAIADRLVALPGVTGVAVATCIPLAEDGARFTSMMRVQGRVLPPGTLSPAVAFCAVSGRYFETMGTSIIRGRGIEGNDVEHRQPVAVINQALANAYFSAGEDPIGQRVTLGPRRDTLWLEIVGIVRNTPLRALAEPSPRPQLYLPMTLSRAGELPVGPDVGVMNYVVRTAASPSGLLPEARGAIKTVDGNLALSQVRTLQDVLARAASQTAFTMVLLAIAAIVALFLGVIGIYGVTSYIVSQRTGEIGVRLALGATPREVINMIVRQGVSVALAGVIVGLAIALCAGGAISSLLYGVSPRDPMVLGTTVVLLLGVALLACWLPASRASRLNPLDALRSD
jgi:putative ABC transport system permease protein